MGAVCTSPAGRLVAQRGVDKRSVTAHAQLFNGLTQKKGSQQGQDAPVKINCRIYSEEGAHTNLELLLSFVDQDGAIVGPSADLSTFKQVPWSTAPGAKDKMSVIYQGEIDIPQDAVNNILFLRMKPDAKVDKEYINRVVISADSDGDGGGIDIAPNSWIHRAQGGRFFFANGLARLPSQTPPELLPWREAELSEAKGNLVQQMDTRADWDRIYDYDIYNDLAKPTEMRNILGGSPEFPYPRRIRTGRPKVRGPDGKPTYETRDTASGSFWIPLDERFNTVKNTNFTLYGLLAVIPTVDEIVKEQLSLGKTKLTSFREVEELYAKIGRPDFTFGLKEFIGALVSSVGKLGRNALRRFGIKPDDLPALQLPGVGSISLGAVGSSIDNIKKLVGSAQHLVEFPPPLVAQKINRRNERTWDTDEEWGRQALAGVNPSCVEAVVDASQLGRITESHLKTALGNASLLALIAAGKTEPRLLVIDHTALTDYASKISSQDGRYGYYGRAVLFQRDDGQWVPAAIELSGEKRTDVYTPKDHPNVWRLAKGVFSSIDSGFHQLITHWLRCHACTEPYIIATHRCLSSLHPVYKLMMPHWRFTPNINANARQNLVQAGGVIESAFTPGRYAMEMSAKVYGALWRFNQQGLPADLMKRGLAQKGGDGKVKLLLKDYPYADDGMLIWDAVHEWVGSYLRCYYDDAVPEKSVAGDVEINSWWNEIKTKGHADVKEGWPELKNIDDLTEILTTMIWIVSAHHAAINFSQYGMSGYFLNRPPMVTKAIPQKDTPEYRALIKDGAAGEKAYLETLYDDNTLKSVLTVELLSTHADNEVYLGEPGPHQYIQDEQPSKLYQDFVAKMRKVEETIDKRNRDSKNKTRNGGTALPYEFLAPSSKQSGISNRGVPQSVSI